MSKPLLEKVPVEWKQAAAAAVQQCAQIARALRAEETGQDLVEYGLIAGLIGLACIASLRGVSTSVSNVFSAVSSKLISST